ncbi:ABC transporter substrate-binding protein [Tissierella sp. MSJ-40]|uniref:ABC transporter substrate-binding protein n=1 Tax=Tissierella simiarum TaxID=2841534 RepID=A0ABS6E6Z1_9FIRM|nr:ABC transporter substrate-binding protein [Tissierella simiarum]MBU5438009.1 ABC transporter substrate-binding protein [Tissierella simiarum]
MTKKFKNVAVLVLALSIVITFTGCSKKSEETSNDVSWENVKDNGKITVGLCAAYPPFESRNDKTGELEGFDIDLAKLLGSELGIEVEIKDAEWPALLGGLNKGDFDVLITCMSKREAAAENVNMSDVYYELNDVIIVKEGRNDINSIEDLKNKIVGVQLGSGSEQVVDKLDGLKEVKRYDYNPEAFIDLENDRIDCVVVGYAYAVNYMKENEGFRLVDEALESAEIVMVLRQGEDGLTNKLNESLSKIKENGKYDEILNKWLKVN